MPCCKKIIEFRHYFQQILYAITMDIQLIPSSLEYGSLDMSFIPNRVIKQLHWACTLLQEQWCKNPRFNS